MLHKTRLARPAALALLVAFSVLTSAQSARSQESKARLKGFTPLFNGKDLTGWKGLVGNPKTRAAMPADELAAAQKKADEEMRAHWSVADGALVFDGKGKSLCTLKDYGDFEMYVDWKILKAGDSGIYLRGSPQVQIWDTQYPDYFRHGAENGSGSLWNNQKNPRFPSAKADKPVGEWNTFYIRMIGERVTVKLNGTLVVDDVVMENIWDRSLPIYPRGQIELQNHGNTLYFKDLSIREIPAGEANAMLAKRERDQHAYEEVFNGRDFTGWSGEVENYEAKDGAIVCKPGKGGTIFTDKEYSDFVAILEFKTPPGGNNGLAIRYPGTGRAHIDGFCELQILDPAYKGHDKLDRRQYHGSVYGLVGTARLLAAGGRMEFPEGHGQRLPGASGTQRHGDSRRRRQPSQRIQRRRGPARREAQKRAFRVCGTQRPGRVSEHRHPRTPRPARETGPA